MENSKLSPAFLRQRRFLLMFPVLVLPFVILLFRLLGGGAGNNSAIPAEGNSGINSKLPDPHFKSGKEKDKFAIYEQAGRDSARLRDALRNDPYAAFEPKPGDSMQNASALQNILQRTASKYNQPSLPDLRTTVAAQNMDINEQNVLKKLEQLKTVINNNRQTWPEAGSINSTPRTKKERQNDPGAGKRIVAKDPELEQLDHMLEKVMLLQHPEKMQDSMMKLSEKNKPKSFLVSKPPTDEVITSMNNRSYENGNGFYGLDDHSALSIGQNAIEAIIPESQTLVAGATVKIRLLNDIFAWGIRIPKDQFIYGTASLSNERLKIAINSVGFRSSIIPVSLSVYDLDGMEGIYIPGSINRDVTKQTADDAISTIGLTTLDPSLAAQAASAGIQAAKSLISKKVKLTRVTLKEGYRVLLKDNNQK